jgi:hypothetical protein
LKSQDKLTKANINLLKAVDSSFDLDFQIDQPALKTWAKFAARHNGGMVSYRRTILDNLQKEGHVVIDSDSPSEADKEKTMTGITLCRDQGHLEEAHAIARAAEISDLEYQQLTTKKAKTQNERHQERKHSLQKRYCSEVTPELVMKDDDGWHPKLALHYYLTTGRQFLASRDLRKAKAQGVSGGGAAWMPDFSRSQLGAVVGFLEVLGCKSLLDPERQFRGTDPDLIRMRDLALANVWGIRAALGISIVDSDTPVAIVQKLLGKLGLKLRCLKREGPRGNRVRVYGFHPPEDGREEVFASWLFRDQVAAEKDSGDDAVSRVGNDPLHHPSPSAQPIYAMPPC